jgi:hypothetical protein
MEKLILTSQNFKDRKTYAKGSFDLFQKISSIANFEHVFIEADFPEDRILLDWDEYILPQQYTAPFLPLISPKMYEYKFQYLASFQKNNIKLSCASNHETSYCERFTAKLNNEAVFSSQDSSSGFCNVSWLLDFLINAKKINADTLRSERLIWQKSTNVYELVLESKAFNKKISEIQVFSFQNNFEYVSWQHMVNML